MSICISVFLFTIPRQKQQIFLPVPVDDLLEVQDGSRFRGPCFDIGRILGYERIQSCGVVLGVSVSYVAEGKMGCRKTYQMKLYKQEDIDSLCIDISCKNYLKDRLVCLLTIIKHGPHI